MEGSPLGTKEGGISEDIDSLTLNGTNGRFQPEWLPLSMTRTDLPGSLCFTMPMERNDISLHLPNFRQGIK